MPVTYFSRNFDACLFIFVPVHISKYSHMLLASTVKFLKNLRKNNNRPWFDAHRNDYLAAKEDFEALVKKVIEEYSKMDTSLAGLQVKDCVFRIYKDVRFSKDKTPYKVSMAASFNKGGKKVHLPGYYLHIEPGGNCFCGGGIWLPEAPELKKIRQEIDYNFKEFHSIITEKNFLKLFDKLEDEGALSRPPQGYDAGNPAIEYLKMKSYIVSRGFTDEELTSSRLLKEIIKTFSTMKPMIAFLQKAMD